MPTIAQSCARPPRFTSARWRVLPVRAARGFDTHATSDDWTVPSGQWTPEDEEFRRAHTQRDCARAGRRRGPGDTGRLALSSPIRRQRPTRDIAGTNPQGSIEVSLLPIPVIRLTLTSTERLRRPSKRPAPWCSRPAAARSLSTRCAVCARISTTAGDSAHRQRPPPPSPVLTKLHEFVHVVLHTEGL